MRSERDNANQGKGETMTKANAIAKLKSWGCNGYIYQYEDGRWDACSCISGVGMDLAASGYIYRHLNCKAKQFERISHA